MDFTITPGFYHFTELSRDLKKGLKGLSLALDETTRLVELSIPDGVVLWLPEAVKYTVTLDDESWLQCDYKGDKPVDFLPIGGYLFI